LPSAAGVDGGRGFGINVLGVNVVEENCGVSDSNPDAVEVAHVLRTAADNVVQGPFCFPVKAISQDNCLNAKNACLSVLSAERFACERRPRQIGGYPHGQSSYPKMQEAKLPKLLVRAPLPSYDFRTGRVLPRRFTVNVAQLY
jgi:hypothetical protein